LISPHIQKKEREKEGKESLRVGITEEGEGYNCGSVCPPWLGQKRRKKEEEETTAKFTIAGGEGREAAAAPFAASARLNGKEKGGKGGRYGSG